MRRLASCLTLAALLATLSVSGPRPAAAAVNPAAPQAPAITYPLPDGVRFIHTATGDTLDGDQTVMTNAATDNLPTTLVFATHNYNPGGEGGQYADRAVSAYYVASVLAGGLHPAGIQAGQWALRNEDAASFESGLAYNVMVTPLGDRAFVHTAGITNTSSNSTYIDHPWLDGRLDRIPFILHDRNPDNITTGLAITVPVGVWYSEIDSQWAIFTEDESTLVTPAAFNVMVGLPGANVFTHTATALNSGPNYTLIDHPLANNNPTALILVTQNWNPAGGTGVYNAHHVGVFYNTSFNLWAIYNEDNAAMPEGASFSVLIDDAKLFLPLLLR